MLLLLFQVALSYNFDLWYKRNKLTMDSYGLSKRDCELAFEENSIYVNHFNSLNNSYKLSMNGKYAGMPVKFFKSLFKPRYEFKKKFIVKSFINTTLNDLYSLKSIPDSIDWRNDLSPIRDQGSCGGCYAFGSVGAIEGRLNIQKNSKFDLSEQQVISCSQPYGNSGCNGGLSYNVYNYIKDNDLAYEYDYPYTASTTTCKQPTKHVKLNSYRSVKTMMKESLINGPIDIAMDVVSSFQFYSNGYYDETNCLTSPNQLNHEMVAVGYGYNNGRLYYIIRNSWGTSWGMNGYAYVYEGVCGVDSDPVEPNGIDLF